MSTELQKMKARAVALLDLLDDIHQAERVIIMDEELQARILSALNDCAWVDE